jgi:hypothetical protein
MNREFSPEKKNKHISYASICFLHIFMLIFHIKLTEKKFNLPLETFRDFVATDLLKKDFKKPLNPIFLWSYKNCKNKTMLME